VLVDTALLMAYVWMEAHEAEKIRLLTMQARRRR
jgi:hypothetical protein